MHDDDYWFKMYVTESIYGQPRGKAMSHRFYDVINGKVKEDTRTGDEIAEDVINRIGLKVRE